MRNQRVYNLGRFDGLVKFAISADGMKAMFDQFGHLSPEDLNKMLAEHIRNDTSGGQLDPRLRAIDAAQITARASNPTVAQRRPVGVLPIPGAVDLLAGHDTSPVTLRAPRPMPALGPAGSMHNVTGTGINRFLHK